MLRAIMSSLLSVFVVASPALAGSVLMSFSGGNGNPIVATLLEPVAYTVTTDTAQTGASFVFRNVGNLTGGAVRFGAGTLSYTVNGGNPLQIDRGGTLALGGVVDNNDLSLFHTPSGAVNLNDVLVLSAGNFSMQFDVAAPPPAPGLYEAILTDARGNQLAVGNTATDLPGDYNNDGAVNAADYVVWRNNDTTPGGYNTWRANFGLTSGAATLLSSAAPEPTTIALPLLAGFFCRSRRRRLLQ